jgi:glycosyltransferase involved in cell wall biosynthesis
MAARSFSFTATHAFVKRPRISIVTPSFNQGRYLEQTILSVLSQGYPNLEYIIIDGGSTDETVEIIRKYESHLAYWVSEPDGGQSEAINKGIALCTGEIFNWLCSDDYLEPGALSELAERFASPDVNVVAGRARLLFPDQSTAYSVTSVLDTAEEMLRKAHICQPSTFFRMRVVEQLGLLNPRLHYMMDAEWWVKYLLLHGKGGITQIPQVLANYRYHSASKSVKETAGFDQDKARLDFAVVTALRLPAPIADAYRVEGAPDLGTWMQEKGAGAGIRRNVATACYGQEALNRLKREPGGKERLDYNRLHAFLAEPGSRLRQAHLLFKRYYLGKLYGFYKKNIRSFVKAIG